MDRGSGINISPLSLGCITAGGPWKGNHRSGPVFYPGHADPTEIERAIHRAIDLGVELFDTSCVYGAGRSERLLGKALGQRRNQIVLTTKFGYDIDEDDMRSESYAQPQSVLDNLKRDCEASLQRLGTNYIDLYLLHIDDYPEELAPLVRDRLEDLVAEGKIRAYGWSTDDPKQARIFAEGKHCAAIEFQMDVTNSDASVAEMLSLCEESRLTGIAHSPLASGLLSGKYTPGHLFPADDRRSSAFYQEHWVGVILPMLDKVKEIPTSGGRSPVQGALAWIWARSNRTIPIPGFKTVKHVEENVAAMEFGHLNDEQMRQIDELLGRSRR